MSNVRSAQTDKVRFFGNTTPQELAAQYGTPLYVYNEDVLRRRCRELLSLSSLPGFHVNYSAKANTNLALLRIVREEGCHADAMSPGELHINKLAGFTPDRLLYVCNNVSAEEMKNAADNGLIVSVDSLSQLDQYGKVNPGGKLAETWANAYAETPAKDNFAGAGRTVQYREGLYVGYRYYQTAGVPVAFPFGYGLSYTSFAYSDLKVTADSVTLTVTNTGAHDGAEIVQVYIAKPGAEIFRPAQELKAFARVPLAAGESRTVTLPLDDKAFRYWNTRTDGWEIEGGRYEVRVGASSADIRLTADVDICGTNAPDPYAGKALPHYKSGSVQNVPDAEWEALLGHPIPQDKVKIDRNMTLGELNHSRSPLGWLIWAVLTALLNASFKKGKPDLNVLFQYNMPLRALAKMTSGAISMGMVDGIVMELQGFWIIGLVRVIVEAVKNLVLNSRMEERLKNS